jgi:hypothetical protein
VYGKPNEGPVQVALILAGCLCWTSSLGLHAHLNTECACAGFCCRHGAVLLLASVQETSSPSLVGSSQHHEQSRNNTASRLHR